MMAEPVSANNSPHAEVTEERPRLRDIEIEDVARETAASEGQVRLDEDDLNIIHDEFGDDIDELDRRVTAQYLSNTHRGNYSPDDEMAGNGAITEDDLQPNRVSYSLS